MRTRLLPYKDHSSSCKALGRALKIKRIRKAGSSFKPRTGDLVINWGCGDKNAPEEYRNWFGGRILNHPLSVSVAVDKRDSLKALVDYLLPVVPFTEDPLTAEAWLSADNRVYARHKVTAHSGEGIEILYPGMDVPKASLYTKGISGKRREFRLHVGMGGVFHKQTKKRVNGWRDNPYFSNEIRNKHTGWVYSLDAEHITEEIEDLAVQSLNALGLDFGAVDIVATKDQVFILEVNTAVGLSNPTTLSKYVEFLEGVIGNYKVLYR